MGRRWIELDWRVESGNEAGRIAKSGDEINEWFWRWHGERLGNNAPL